MVHKGAAGLKDAGGAIKEGLQGGLERLQTLSQASEYPLSLIRLTRSSAVFLAGLFVFLAAPALIVCA